MAELNLVIHKSLICTVQICAAYLLRRLALSIAHQFIPSVLKSIIAVPAFFIRKKNVHVKLWTLQLIHQCCAWILSVHPMWHTDPAPYIIAPPCPVLFPAWDAWVFANKTHFPVSSRIYRRCLTEVSNLIERTSQIWLLPKQKNIFSVFRFDLVVWNSARRC